MATIVLVVHLLLALGLAGVVLIQRSEGGMGGLGGASGGMGGVMGNRSAANLLTRTTGILAAGFMATSIALAILAGQGGNDGPIVQEQPAGTAVPAAPARPAVPTND